MRAVANCHCFIRHAVGDDERVRVGQRLEEARLLGDTNGIIIALAMLANSCPARQQRREAHARQHAEG